MVGKKDRIMIIIMLLWTFEWHSLLGFWIDTCGSIFLLHFYFEKVRGGIEKHEWNIFINVLCLTDFNAKKVT